MCKDTLSTPAICANLDPVPRCANAEMKETRLSLENLGKYIQVLFLK